MIPANLVSAAVAGDRQAVDALVRWIRPLVVRFCRARLGRQERTFASADDVAQDVCLAVLSALPNYRDQGKPFLAFVYGIASHKISDARRVAGRNRSDPVADVPDQPVVGDDPELRAELRELGEQVGQLLEVLSPRQRDILTMRVVLGMSAEDTAKAIGSTPGAVRIAQHRALNRLRAELAGGALPGLARPGSATPPQPDTSASTGTRRGSSSHRSRPSRPSSPCGRSQA